MTLRRAFFAVALGCSILGLRADEASAALFLEFSALRAAPGDTVTARTGGRGAFGGPIPSSSPPIRVFLVSRDVVSPTEPDLAVRSPDDERLSLLGTLTIDENGNGEVTFTVPDVPAGDYTTVLHCVPCATYSAGRELLKTGPSEPFVVLPGGDGTALPTVLAAVALIGGAVGVVVLRLMRRT